MRSVITMDQGIPYHAMAVLFRTNTQARMLLEKMMEYNIPFKMQDAMPNIYQHWVTQDMMAYIQIALGKYSQKSLSEDYQPTEPLCEQADAWTSGRWLLMY